MLGDGSRMIRRISTPWSSTAEWVSLRARKLGGTDLHIRRSGALTRTRRAALGGASVGRDALAATAATPVS